MYRLPATAKIFWRGCFPVLTTVSERIGRITINKLYMFWRFPQRKIVIKLYGTGYTNWPCCNRMKARVMSSVIRINDFLELGEG